MSRPREIFLVGFLSVAFGAMFNASAVASLLAYSGSQDTFASSMKESFASVLRAGVGDEKSKDADANRADIDAIGTRRADVLWSYRNVLLPLAAWQLLVGTLILAGALCVTYGSIAVRGWGRSVWQLGALVGVPRELLAGYASRGQAREVAARLADLHSPFAELLKTAPKGVAPMLVEIAVAALLLAMARYLGGATMSRWVEPEPT